MLGKLKSRATLIHIAVATVFIFCATFLLFEPSIVHAADSPVDTFIQEQVQKAAGGLLDFCGGNAGSCFVWIFAHVGIITMQFSLFILGVMGVLLDLVLLLTFNMGAILAPGTSAGDAVAAGWTIFRDLANLMFIAGFVWVSIAMILQVSVPGQNVGKFVANIIIAALLVNFSYFFTGAAVDVSNNISRLIYEQGVLNGDQSLTIGAAAGNRIESIDSLIGRITSGAVQNGASGTLGGVGSVAGSIPGSGTVAAGAQPYLSFVAGQFLHQTKLVSILDPEGLKQQADENITVGLTFLIYLGVIFIGMTIELFGSMFFVVAARFIILTLLLILSPLVVFRLMGIAPFSAWGDQWWKALMSQLVFLPVFVFLLAVSFHVISGFVETFAGSEVSLSSLLGSPSGNEFNTALGLVLLFFIAYGLLKYSKTVAENLAQGKEVPLPGTDILQKPAAEIGSQFGKLAARTGAFPRAAGRSAIGWSLRGSGAALNALGNATGVSGATRDFGRAVGDTWQGRPTWLGGDPFTVARAKKARAETADVGSILSDIDRYDAARKKAIADGDLQGERAATESMMRAKEKLKEKAGNMYETLGASGMADALAGLDGKGQEAFLDALDDEKAREVYEALRGKGAYKAPAKGGAGGAGGAAGSTTGGGSEGLGSDKLLAELKGMRRDQRIEAMREKKRDMAGVTATREGITKLRTEVGSGAVGELPVDLIINNNNVLDALDDADMAVIKGRKDITPEEYETIERQREIQQKRKGAPQPADIARPESPKSEENGGNDQPPMGGPESMARSK